MPHKVWAVGEEVLAADFNTYVQDQTVQVFPNLAGLQADWPSAPIGAMAVVADTVSRYIHVAAGSAGWVPLGPSAQSTMLTGTIPNSTGTVTVGTVTVAAAPYARLLVWSGLMSVTTTATAVFQLALTPTNGTATFGRGQGTGLTAPCPPSAVILPPNTASTITAAASFTTAPGTTGALVADARFSRLDVLAYPA